VTPIALHLSNTRKTIGTVVPFLQQEKRIRDEEDNSVSKKEYIDKQGEKHRKRGVLFTIPGLASRQEAVSVFEKVAEESHIDLQAMSWFSISNPIWKDPKLGWRAHPENHLDKWRDAIQKEKEILDQLNAEIDGLRPRERVLKLRARGIELQSKIEKWKHDIENLPGTIENLKSDLQTLGSGGGDENAEAEIAKSQMNIANKEEALVRAEQSLPGGEAALGKILDELGVATIIPLGEAEEAELEGLSQSIARLGWRVSKLRRCREKKLRDVNKWERETAKKEEIKPRGTDDARRANRKKFSNTLEKLQDLEKFPAFNAFIGNLSESESAETASGIDFEVPLSPRLRRLIQAGAHLGALQILPLAFASTDSAGGGASEAKSHSLAGMRVHANVMVNVPTEVAKAVPPRFAGQLLGTEGNISQEASIKGGEEAGGEEAAGTEGGEKEASGEEAEGEEQEAAGEEEGGGEEVVLGIDLNRLDCLRTTCYALLKVAGGDAEAIDIEGIDIPREVWAMLLDVADFSGGAPVVSKAGEVFLSKIEGAIVDDDVFGMDMPLPARSAGGAGGTGVEGAKSRLTFNDRIGAPIKRWSGKRAHLMAHMRRCQRAKRAIKAKGTAASGDFILGKKKLRLEREIFLLNRRYESLRKAMKQYASRVLAYMLVQFQPSGVGYENLQVDPEGQDRGLAQIVQGMFKDFKELQDPAVLALRTASSGGYKSPHFVTVTPRNTSKYDADCRLAGDAYAEVDRRTSADVGLCEGVLAEGHPGVVDCHYSAAKNIALNYNDKEAKVDRVRSRRAFSRKSPSENETSSTISSESGPPEGGSES
jgi:hypothetical protein